MRFPYCSSGIAPNLTRHIFRDQRYGRAIIGLGPGQIASGNQMAADRQEIAGRNPLVTPDGSHRART